MKTKFTKVAVSERKPEKDGFYYVYNGGHHVTYFSLLLGFNLCMLDGKPKKITHWLEEIEDKEDEMIEMLEGCKKSLDFVYENWKYPMYFDEDGKEEPEAIEHVLYRRQELDKLLQSLKQEK